MIVSLPFNSSEPMFNKATLGLSLGYSEVYKEAPIIEKSDKGKWLINIENYTIQDESNPTYIKYTVFKNYGRPNEIKKVEVIDLN